MPAEPSLASLHRIVGIIIDTTRFFRATPAVGCRNDDVGCSYITPFFLATRDFSRFITGALYICQNGESKAYDTRENLESQELAFIVGSLRASLI